ncbi:MAG: aldehyde dehydrogenase family protein, partial [Aggregatilineales bacterium]
MKALLEKLQLTDINAGACTGADGWITDPDGEKLDSINPATGEVIASVIMPTVDTYNQVVESAQSAFETWRTMPAPLRGNIIRELGNALRELKEPLGELVSLEMGKIKAEGMGEVQEMIDICDFAVGLSRQLYGLTMHSERPGHRMYEQWHPMGAIGVITAFNFPVAVWAWNSALAAVCGDTVIWKPSEVTPLTAVAVQHICNRVTAAHDLPQGIFTLAVGAKEIGEAISNDKRLPLVSFTGSVRTGKIVAKTVAGRLGRSILELGGNNAIIVTEDADLEMAVRAIVFGAVGTAGQRCTSTRRIIAHENIVDTLTERLIKAYKQVNIGNPLDESTLMGPLVNKRAVDGMMSAIEAAKSQGGEVLCGGNTLPDKGANYVEPTIIKMPEQTPLVCDETFAPILYIMTYETLDEAIAIHNGVPQGLSSAIFTNNMRTSERFLSVAGSDCGIANVNIGTSGAEIGG